MNRLLVHYLAYRAAYALCVYPAMDGPCVTAFAETGLRHRCGIPPEKNGYSDDINAVDDKPVPRGVLPVTQGMYDVQMDLWDE